MSDGRDDEALGPPGPWAEQGRRIAAAREQRGLSREEVSRRTGFSVRYLARAERGLVNPYVALGPKLVNALGVPLVDLLGPRDSPTPGRAPQPALPPPAPPEASRVPEGPAAASGGSDDRLDALSARLDALLGGVDRINERLDRLVERIEALLERRERES